MPSIPRPQGPLVDPIWEQQPNEAKNHYAWFTVYAALKSYDRTYQRAWDIIQQGGRREGTRKTDYFGMVGSAWKWIERAAAKDLFDAQTAQSKWMERDKERREEAYQVGEKLVKQAKRVLNKIEQLPDDQLKVSLSEAKDVAATGIQIQEAAIPTMRLAVDQMQWLISTLPPEKRAAVMQKLQAARESPAGLLGSGNEVEGEYDVLDGDTEEEEDTE